LDRNQAVRLIRETLESPFDRDRFAIFACNLLSHVTDAPFLYRGNYIRDAFADYISTLERIGKYEDPTGKKMDILVAQLRKETSLVYARTVQRDFIAWYLNGSRGGELKDAALVAFVAPDEADWRFSLVKMEYELAETPSGRVRAKPQFTPARRYSFLVGSHETSHTAQAQLVDVLEREADPTLDELETAFGVERVTREFFAQYRDLFIRVKDGLDEVLKSSPAVRRDFSDKDINTVDFAKKLLGQVVFLYFLQKKGWFGVGRDDQWGSGPRDFLRRLFNRKYGDYQNFFDDILEPLFYEALATQRTDDFYRLLNCKIPFLNGGLFDPIGRYDWVHADLHLPDAVFSNLEPTENDLGTGVLDVFDRFNFTVREDEPLEKEVAIDPELLGKIYEKFNAITAENYGEYKVAVEGKRVDLERKFNKRYGVYYTPRDIVQYICQQTLTDHLATVLQGEVSRADAEFLVRHGESLVEHEAVAQSRADAIAAGKIKTTKEYKSLLPDAIVEHAPAIDAVLAGVRVCDPAVGSGAFPVGMMTKIVRARLALNPCLGLSRSMYDLKRHAIQSSLYGVDIDPGAVEIAKLRLWLSLVVDEQERHRIKALPNLDYKIMQGNSLVSEFLDVDLDTLEFGDSEQLDFSSSDLQTLVAEFRSKKDRFLTEPHSEQKEELRCQIEDTIVNVFELELHRKRSDFAARLRAIAHKASQITNRQQRDDFKRKEKAKLYRGRELSQRELVQLRKYASSREVRPFFLWKLYFAEVFAEKGGFDIVIGNPPYVRQEKLQESKDYLCLHYDVYSGTADLYAYFVERGIELLHNEGQFAYIVSNKWFRADYGTALRSWLKARRIQEVVDFGDLPVFENVTTYPCILRVARTPPAEAFGVTDVATLDYGSLAQYVAGHSHEVKLVDLNDSGWSLANRSVQDLLRKIKAAGIPLGKYVKGKIYYGIKTGLNEAFVIDAETRKRLIAEDRRNEETIKPLVEGRNIEKWAIGQINKWLVFTPIGVEINRYPAVFRHLGQWQHALEKRVDQGKQWWELRACDYYDAFNRPKIMWGNMGLEPRFAYSPAPLYTIAPANVIPIKDFFLLGLVNSSLSKWFFSAVAIQRGGDYLEFKPIYVKQFPVCISDSGKVSDSTGHDKMGSSSVCVGEVSLT
jgi:hypothetical protein